MLENFVTTGTNIGLESQQFLEIICLSFYLSSSRIWRLRETPSDSKLNSPLISIKLLSLILRTVNAIREQNFSKLQENSTVMIITWFSQLVNRNTAKHRL